MEMILDLHRRLPDVFAKHTVISYNDEPALAERWGLLREHAEEKGNQVRLLSEAIEMTGRGDPEDAQANAAMELVMRWVEERPELLAEAVEASSEGYLCTMPRVETRPCYG